MNDDEIMYKRLFEVFNEEEFNEYLSREAEPLGEMASVGSTDNPIGLKVQVNPDPNRSGNPYFKVYSSKIPKAGQDKVARLHFLDDGMEYHKDGFKDWILTTSEIKMIKSFLNKNHHREKEYTNWEMTKWLWNLEYGFFSDEQIDDYMNGKLDNIQHPSYVPSTTPIPDSWVYDPPKNKNKRSLRED